MTRASGTVERCAPFSRLSMPWCAVRTQTRTQSYRYWRQKAMAIHLRRICEVVKEIGKRIFVFIQTHTSKHKRTHCPHLTIFNMEHIAGGQESRRWHKQTINIYSGNIIWISWAYISIKLTFEYVDEHKSRLCIRWYTSVISRMLTVRSLNGQLRIVIVWNWFFKQ